MKLLFAFFPVLTTTLAPPPSLEVAARKCDNINLNAIDIYLRAFLELTAEGKVSREKRKKKEREKREKKIRENSSSEELDANVSSFFFLAQHTFSRRRNCRNSVQLSRINVPYYNISVVRCSRVTVLDLKL